MDTIKHICQPQYANLPGMKEFYSATNMLPTSTVADTALIRSHIAYHAGERFSSKAVIRPSRGHSYRVDIYGNSRDKGVIVKITDHYDHRDGVVGLFSYRLKEEGK